MLRLFVLVIVFALIVFALPGWPPAANVLGTLRQLPSQTALIANIAALIIGLPLLVLQTRQPHGWLYTRPGLVTRTTHAGALGLVIASLFSIFDALSGYAITLDSLVLITVAFVMGELVYQFLHWIWTRATGAAANTEAADRVATFEDAPAEQQRTSSARPGIPRLLVTLPIYAFLLVFIPQREEFRQLEASLITIAPLIAFGLSVAALVAAIGLAIWASGQQNAEQAGESLPAQARYKAMAKRQLAMTGAIGLGIAGLINAVGFLLSVPPSLSLLMLMPLGFVIAEAVYFLIDWRMRFPPI